VVDGFAAFLCGGDGDFEAFLDLCLPGEIGKVGDQWIKKSNFKRVLQVSIDENRKT